MRWFVTDNSVVTGTRRLVRGFLWFPKGIKSEYRWLETCLWEEEFKVPSEWSNQRALAEGGEWVPIKWVDKED